MRYILLFFAVFIYSITLYSQVVLTIEGTVVNDPETGISPGVVIPNNFPTILTYRNNSVTAVSSGGYMLCAGDEIPGPNNNHLDGAKITGNKFVWNGTNEESTTHGLFTGYNLNVLLKYNYLYRIPNGIQRKSNGMTDLDGLIAYNIINNPKVGIVIKGMNGVKIYNNTLYSEQTQSQTSRGLIDIHTNFDDGLNAPSTGTKIFNNIFYTKDRTINIKIYESVCLTDFECDYNVYWCEAGEPVFEVAGVKKTFTQWQAMGYDIHSLVVNPEFKDFTDFVPAMRLDYGKALGASTLKGLSVKASWSNKDPEVTDQNGPWQVGARIYETVGEGVKIYPNPAINSFNIMLSHDAAQYSKFSLYDFNGRVVQVGEIEKGSNIISLPVTFSSGCYTVVLEGVNLESHLQKIIILK